jgi:hypothetical protein
MLNHEHFPNAILKMGRRTIIKQFINFNLSILYDKMKIWGCCYVVFYNLCNSQTNEDQNLISTTIDSGFAKKETDVGWLPQMETQDINFMILTELKKLWLF